MKKTRDEKLRVEGNAGDCITMKIWILVSFTDTNFIELQIGFGKFIFPSVFRLRWKNKIGKILCGYSNDPFGKPTSLENNNLIRV